MKFKCVKVSHWITYMVHIFFSVVIWNTNEFRGIAAVFPIAILDFNLKFYSSKFVINFSLKTQKNQTHTHKQSHT